MGFERFGKLSFASQTRVDAFVDYLDEGELRFTRCRVCDSVYFPPRADCANCLSCDMEWIRVDEQGTLISFTRANFAPTGFEDDVPYILAVADFNRVKVFGRFGAGVSDDQLEAGMPVTVKSVSLGEGRISYEFLPFNGS